MQLHNFQTCFFVWLFQVYDLFLNCPLHVLEQNRIVDILDGVDEGLYEWVTVNFIRGKCILVYCTCNIVMLIKIIAQLNFTSGFGLLNQSLVNMSEANYFISMTICWYLVTSLKHALCNLKKQVVVPWTDCNFWLPISRDEGSMKQRSSRSFKVKVWSSI